MLRETRHHLAKVVLVCALGLLTGLSGASQQAPPERAPAVALRVTTRLVLVDVVVTDKQGRPATGLTRDDFTLLESGKAQRISVFAFEGPETHAAETEPPPPLPENVYTNRPAVRRTAGPPTILLLDMLNTAQRDQIFAREKMLDYLQTQLQPDQQYAIFALSSNLVLLQDFTSDPRLLQAALENFRTKKSVEISRGEPHQIPPDVPALGRVLERIERINTANLVESIDSRVRITLAALRAIARAVDGLPGRKNLVWVSAAFPFTFTPANPNDSDLFRAYGPEIRRTTALLADAQVAIYPVDARGLVGVAHDAAFDPRVTNPRQRVGMTIDEEELTNRVPFVVDSHQAMEQIAVDTGGRAYLNRNDIAEAVALSQADGSTYYTLGYYPEGGAWDGRWHKLEVKLARKGLQVRHRRGFYAADPLRAWQEEPEKDELLRAALTDPLPPSAVTFLASVPPAAPASSTQIDIAFSIDVRTVAFETFEDGSRQGSLDILAVAYSAGADPVAASRTLGVRLPAEAYAGAEQRGLVFRLPLQLEPGEYELRLLVRDNRTGLTGRLDLPYTVPTVAP